MPLFRVSLPPPPSSSARPAVNVEASRVLSPAPPVRRAASIPDNVSLPSDPMVSLVLVRVKSASRVSTTVSSPAYPVKVSAPGPPVNVLLSPSPVRESMPAPPMAFRMPLIPGVPEAEPVARLTRTLVVSAE